MKIINGTKISKGIAMGRIYHLTRDDLPIPQHSIEKDQIESEFLLLRDTIAKCANELKQIKTLAIKHLDQEHAQIIDGQLMILQDKSILIEVEKYVKKKKKNVIFSYSEIMTKYEAILSKSNSNYHQQRNVDIVDIKKRLIHHLLVGEKYHTSQLKQPSIIVASRISPADLLHLDHKKTLGIISEVGGADSHIAIIAKSFGIPYLSNVKEINEIIKYKEIILNADEESILIDIDFNDKSYYKKLVIEFQETKKARFEDSVRKTKDNVPFEIYLNVGFTSELDFIDFSTILGIGLFRTEFLSIEEDSIPNEENQLKVYKSAVRKAKGSPIVFRTFDFGRDKFIDMLDLDMFHHDRSFEDWGGIQFCLENPDILKTQLRALLKASHYGPIKIMFPMVATLEEVIQSKAILNETKEELTREGIKFDHKVQVGIMIETEAILDVMDDVAGEVDFFSIGTNDLAAFLTKSKRDESRIKNHYHPKMFRAIKKIVETTARHDIPLSVCGEMASDPYALIGLVALGIRKISINTSSLHQIRQEIKKMDTKIAESITDRLLTETSTFTVFSYLKNFYRTNIV